MNLAIMKGNLTKDPILRSINSGEKATQVCDISIAVNREYKTQSGPKKDTTFMDVVVWGPQAAACGQYLKKGRQVLVRGRIDQQTWEKEGQKRSKHVLVAERVEFLGGPRAAQAAPEAPETSEEVPF